MALSSDDDENLLIRPSADFEDDDDYVYDNVDDLTGNLTLRETAALACKSIDIGTAVLPKPLFEADVEDTLQHVIGGNSNNNNNNPGQQQDQSTQTNRSVDGNEEQGGGIETETRYSQVLAREFNAVVIEHHLKWAPLCVSEPGPLENSKPSDRLGRYDFYHADRILDWCYQNDINTIKGHVLVWHVTTPKFVQDLEPDQVREQLRRHIFTTMGHYRGRVKYWDVVNEALAPDGSLAETVFYRKLGPNYIEDCFRWAHEADPDCLLLYNDNKVEGIGSPKSEGLYELLANLKAKNVPIHGCGLQAHFNAAGTGVNRPPTPRAVKQQIRRIGKLGLRVNISEMDVRTSKLRSEWRDAAQKQIYRDILTAALTEPSFDGIWLWGFTDRHTWVHNFYYDDEPCVFDENYKRKPAYFGVREAIATLVPGGRIGGGIPLNSDLDARGEPWGREWMVPEPMGGGTMEEQQQQQLGDARPDWEIEEQQLHDDEDDSGIEADVEEGNHAILSEDDDDERLPPIS